MSRLPQHLLTAVLAAGLLLALLPAAPVLADHTDPPSSVTLAGDLQSELGCPDDWQPDCAATALADDDGDGSWTATFAVPAGTWSYKVALNGSWDENYGAGGTADGDDIALTLEAETDVTFTYDHATHEVSDNAPDDQDDQGGGGLEPGDASSCAPACATT